MTARDADRPRIRVRRARAIYVVTTLAVLLLAGCGSAAATPVAWAKPYNETTCADWNDLMTIDQRWLMTATYLDALWKVDDPAAGIPPAEVVDRFDDAITAVCEQSGLDVSVSSFTIANMAADLYSGSNDLHPPK